MQCIQLIPRSRYKKMVHVAPNKYRFPSRTAFEQCLQKEYGWQQAKSRQRRPLQKNKRTIPQQQPQQKECKHRQKQLSTLL
jgi:hypothetical protein